MYTRVRYEPEGAVIANTPSAPVPAYKPEYSNPVG